MALARGNSAANDLALSGTASPATFAAVDAGAQRTDVTAQAALFNGQSNLGAVSAAALIAAQPLNAPGAGITNASLSITGNSASAVATGNAATNTVSVSSLGRPPVAAIANYQVNGSPVTAQVTGSGFALQPAGVAGSALRISGNQLVAAATGNQAVSTIATTR